MIKNTALVKQLIMDFRQAELREADQAMLEYAAKLTSAPWKMEDGRSGCKGATGSRF